MKALRTYILGFVVSIALTVVAFALAQMHLASGHIFPTHELAVPALVALALVQLVVQLMLFLHVGQEPKPRWNLLAFYFAIIVVVILVGGTLWIMDNLTHMQMQEPYNVFEEENIFPHGHAE
jgi:cytochrome o ubiquinol oxidase operon protein cyoD